MKSLITTFLAVGLFGAVSFEQSIAQSVKQDKRETREAAAASSLYIISAKAGAVNYVAGKVAINRNNAKSGYLVKGDTVDKDEVIKTGNDGKAEILLNPGSYVRLSENANFKFNSTSLDDLRVSLTSGSAMFEVITDNNFEIVVSTPKSSYQLVKSGVYRIDALSDGTAKISVWKGKAKYGAGKNDVIKGGQTTAIVNGQISVQKFDRDNKGEFEIWSRDRAKEIARANAKLQQKAMNRSLISSFMQGGYGSWGSSNRFGLWVFDASVSGYCFLPFGYGWSSPYGFGFSRSIWSYGLPNQIYSNINPTWNNTVYQPNPNSNNSTSPNNGNLSRPPSFNQNVNPSSPMEVPAGRPAPTYSNGERAPISAKQMPIVD